MKLYILRRIDIFVLRHPRISVNVYIDDVGLASTADARAAVATVAAATVEVEQMLDSVGCKLASGKTQVLATTAKMRGKLKRILQLCDDQVGESGVFLGADFAPRTSRRRWIGRSCRRQRLAKIRRRAKRLGRLRKAAGPRACLVASAGLAPQGSYGAEISGFSDNDVLSSRRSLAAGAGPRASGRSLSAVLLLEGDDTCRAAVAPIVRWSDEVWRAVSGLGGGLSLPELRRIWDGAMDKAPTTWAQERGPVGAAILSDMPIG